MTRLSLAFDGMPERHAELAWRFGEPDECLVSADSADATTSRWVLRSPCPSNADVADHLTWAAECLGPHEAFVGELISLGGRVTVRLEAQSNDSADGMAFAVNGRVLLPMAHAGVRLEFQVR